MHCNFTLRSTEATTAETRFFAAHPTVEALSLTVADEIVYPSFQETGREHGTRLGLRVVEFSNLDVAVGTSETMGADALVGRNHDRLGETQTVGTTLTFAI